MDKLEKEIYDGLIGKRNQPELDVDALLQGTHRKIQRRAMRRRTVYSAPVVLLLFLAVWSMSSRDTEVDSLPGVNLFAAGTSQLWTEQVSVGDDDLMNTELYDEGLDYLFDGRDTGYLEDADDLLSENDLEAFKRFIEEV